MRLFILILLISTSGICGAASPSPDKTLGNEETTSTTPETEEITSTSLASTTEFNPLESYQKQRDEYIQKQKELFDELKVDHELCLTGDQRSPVDLSFESALPTYLPGIEFVNYDIKGRAKEVTLNHSAAFDGFNQWENAPFIRGGALEGEFVLWQLHQNAYHSIAGAEGQVAHSINKAFYDFEMHFIHVKKGMTLDEARGVSGAITIVAVEYKWKKMSSERYTQEELIEEYSNSSEIVNGTTYKLLRPIKLIPSDTTSFFNYNGSMPHSPCTPGVNWIVLTRPVPMSHDKAGLYLTYPYAGTNQLAELAEVPTIGNRTVLFNFGEMRNPSRVQGFSIYTVIIFAVSSAVVTWTTWFIVDKYAKKPIERGYVKYFVPNKA